jgi:ABC-type dipeptide/oligopeptide/nickel transport system permease component
MARGSPSRPCFPYLLIVGPLGLMIGVVAGYFGGRTDALLMRATDIVLSFPSLILALAFAAALGAGLNTAIIAISLTGWPPIARLARAEALVVATPTMWPPPGSTARRPCASCFATSRPCAFPR